MHGCWCVSGRCQGLWQYDNVYTCTSSAVATMRVCYGSTMILKHPLSRYYLLSPFDVKCSCVLLDAATQQYLSHCNIRILAFTEGVVQYNVTAAHTLAISVQFGKLQPLEHQSHAGLCYAVLFTSLMHRFLTLWRHCVNIGKRRVLCHVLGVESLRTRSAFL
jgi:hypothetical protein